MSRRLKSVLTLNLEHVSLMSKVNVNEQDKFIISRIRANIEKRRYELCLRCQDNVLPCTGRNGVFGCSFCVAKDSKCRWLDLDKILDKRLAQAMNGKRRTSVLDRVDEEDDNNAESATSNNANVGDETVTDEETNSSKEGNVTAEDGVPKDGDVDIGSLFDATSFALGSPIDQRESDPLIVDCADLASPGGPTSMPFGLSDVPPSLRGVVDFGTSLLPTNSSLDNQGDAINNFDSTAAANSSFFSPIEDSLTPAGSLMSALTRFFFNTSIALGSALGPNATAAGDTGTPIEQVSDPSMFDALADPTPFNFFAGFPNCMESTPAAVSSMNVDTTFQTIPGSDQNETSMDVTFDPFANAERSTAGMTQDETHPDVQVYSYPYSANALTFPYRTPDYQDHNSAWVYVPSNFDTVFSTPSNGSVLVLA